MIDDNKGALIRRRLLEDFREAQRASPLKPFVNCRYLPTVSAYAPGYILRQLEILEHEGRVELKEMGNERMINLTALGWKSLEVTGDEWLTPTSTSPGENATRIDIRHANVGNIAQVSGSEETHITQGQSSHPAELRDLASAIDELADAIKANSSMPADVKNDAQIEADQLKGELRKSKPSLSRIQQGIEWFKALDSVATVLPHVLDVADRLKQYLPKMF